MKRKEPKSQGTVQQYRRSFKHTLLLTVTTFIAIVCVCSAWFLNNQRVSADGIHIQSTSIGFELATVGTEGAFSPQIWDGEGGWTDLWDQGSEIVIDNKQGKSTAGDTPQVSWMMSTDSNLGNSGDMDEPGIYPGSSGSLTFYVIPHAAGTLQLTFTLNLELYQEATEETGFKVTKEIMAAQEDVPTAATTEIQLAKQDDVIVQSLLEGHLLFFQNKTEAGLLEDWISGDTFEATITAKADQDGNVIPVPVTIYWVWPYVLGQELLPASRLSQLGWSSLFTQETQKALALDMQNLDENGNTREPGETNGRYFVSDGGTDMKSSEVQEMVAAVYSGTYATTVYAQLSNYYNNADQYIGEHARYVRLVLTAQS
jgi:hypothetical protein